MKHGGTVFFVASVVFNERGNTHTHSPPGPAHTGLRSPDRRMVCVVADLRDDPGSRTASFQKKM